MRHISIGLCLLFLVVFTGQAWADFIIYPNGDTKFGKILIEGEDSIDFQFGCEKTEDNVEKILKKDLLNFGPHPYCQYPPQSGAGAEAGAEAGE